MRRIKFGLPLTTFLLAACDDTPPPQAPPPEVFVVTASQQPYQQDRNPGLRGLPFPPLTTV